MAVMILPSGIQTFIDTEAVERMARAAESVKKAHSNAMQTQWTLTFDGSSCDIVTNHYSEAQDIVRDIVKSRKSRH